MSSARYVTNLSESVIYVAKEPIAIPSSFDVEVIVEDVERYASEKVFFTEVKVKLLNSKVGTGIAELISPTILIPSYVPLKEGELIKLGYLLGDDNIYRIREVSTKDFSFEFKEEKSDSSNRFFKDSGREIGGVDL